MPRANSIENLTGEICTDHRGRQREGLTRDELLQVARARRMGANWDACARMVGRSRPDVERHCNPASPDFIDVENRGRPA